MNRIQPIQVKVVAVGEHLARNRVKLSNRFGFVPGVAVGISEILDILVDVLFAFCPSDLCVDALVVRYIDNRI